jgi:protein-S-isoprenylcysteine O-methyltransferase Ste14
MQPPKKAMNLTALRAAGDRQGVSGDSGVTSRIGGSMSGIRLATLAVTMIAFARTAWVVVGFVRTLLRSQSIVAARWGWVEVLTIPEPLVLAGVTYTLAANGTPQALPAGLHVAGPVAGAAIALGGLALTAWAFLSLPSVGSGHYVLEGQPIVNRGAYGWVRHPLYLAAFMIWFALALAYLSVLPLLVLVLYVIPIYSLYIREEERLMTERYGDAYREYRNRVGGLVPRLHA